MPACAVGTSSRDADGVTRCLCRCDSAALKISNKKESTVSLLTPIPLELGDGPLKQAITDLRSPQTSQELAMLHAIKKTAIQITAIAMLTTAASYALAAPAGYAAPSGEEACVTSPSSLNHAPCTNGGN